MGGGINQFSPDTIKWMRRLEKDKYKNVYIVLSNMY